MKDGNGNQDLERSKYFIIISIDGTFVSAKKLQRF